MREFVIVTVTLAGDAAARAFADPHRAAPPRESTAADTTALPLRNRER
jgi:hypothetical protein